MISMLAIMKDTDDHFEEVVDKLGKLHDSLEEQNNKIIFLKNIDKDK